MGKLSMKLKIVINYLKSLKKSKLHIDKDIYNAARYKVRKMIFNKKKSFFEIKKKKKSSDSIGEVEDLWQVLKSIGLANIIFSCEVRALKINNTVEGF